MSVSRETIFIADFETRSGARAIDEGITYVWAWAMSGLGDFEAVETGNRIDQFFTACRRHAPCTIYFHNLKFDGRFIIDKLFREGYKHVETEKGRHPGKKEFSTMISEMGVWYSIEVNFGYRRNVVFRDSLKKLPFTVAEIGDAFKTKYRKLGLDYAEERPETYEMTPMEREYIKNDVRVVAEALHVQYEHGMEKMTIASDCLDYYITMMGGKDAFRRWFPFLSREEDAFVRKSYKGGWCYLKEGGIYKNGRTYDVNSLYPSMMHSISGNYYPFGAGIYYEGAYEEDSAHPLYVQHLIVWAVLKNGYLPTIQIKGNALFPSNEWISDTQGPVELYLTNIDLDLLLEHYDILSLVPIDGYKYQAVKGIFDQYIDHFAEQKKREKGALRTLAKLYLNSFYGKFGARVEQANKIPALGDDDIVHFTSSDTEERPGVYIPVATFVTAYSRRFTITAAQANFDNFVYADTDSIHITGEAVGIKVHDKDFCCWKHESDWVVGVFRRQKTYIEIVDSEWKKTYEEALTKEEVEKRDIIHGLAQAMIKCAGMPKEAKAVFLGMLYTGEKTLEDFDIGLVIPGAKLVPKTVKGGVILVPVDFSMNENAFMH